MRLDLNPAGTVLDAWTVPYPFVAVPGASALAAIRALENAHPHSSAVIWGDRAEAARLFEQWDDLTAVGAAGEIAATLQASAGRGVDALEHYRAGVEAALATSYRERGFEPAEDADTPPIESDGPLPLPHSAPIGLVDHRTGGLKPEVLIGLLPTPNPYEAPAYHLFGGRNDCPPAAIHVGLGRDWAKRYGARLIVNTHDVIEYEIARPIETREEALELAWVHYRYCGDTVSQVVGSIEGLAATLKGGRFWYFWWE